jgi:hypothetical protein
MDFCSALHSVALMDFVKNDNFRFNRMVFFRVGGSSNVIAVKVNWKCRTTLAFLNWRENCINRSWVVAENLNVISIKFIIGFRNFVLSLVEGLYIKIQFMKRNLHCKIL